MWFTCVLMNMTAKGYKINHKRLSSACVCKKCIQKIPLDTNDSQVSELTTENYGTFYCTICERDITKGGGNKQIDYPEEIALLFEKSFDGRGPRFGGVHPMISSAGKKEKEFSEGAKKIEPIKSEHDRVIIEVREESLKNDLQSMINTLSQQGRIRGQMNTIETDNDDNIYEFNLFARL